MPSSAENILYADYIRYDKLYELTKYAFYGSPDPGNEIDIFIDMNSMLRSLYIWSENVLFDKDNVITSSMLNLAAHLKHYLSIDEVITLSLSKRTFSLIRIM